MASWKALQNKISYRLQLTSKPLEPTLIFSWSKGFYRFIIRSTVLDFLQVIWAQQTTTSNNRQAVSVGLLLFNFAMGWRVPPIYHSDIDIWVPPIYNNWYLWNGSWSVLYYGFSPGSSDSSPESIKRWRLSTIKV